MTEYLDTLNEPQREGVLTTEGPVMLIAGAGSGKTRVLTFRIAYLIREKNVDPFSIMALTFTNKAAKEMRERIEKVVGSDARSLMMGTFHSVFSRILRAEAHHIGYPNNFTIYDTDDVKQLLRTIIKEKGLDDAVYKVNTVLSRISSAKNKLIGADEYLRNAELMGDDAANMRPEIGNIYKIYTNRLYKSGAMDFDDLLFNTDKLFKEHLDVLNKYQQRIQYLMVDEFQDTNLCQYYIIRKLAAVRENVCVVGDDAQSIYAFRGADITNILNFERDYADLKVIKLEQNYRSTSNIVQAANSVIKRNRAQLPKNVWTANEEGKLIELIKAVSDNEEGRLVATSIFQERMQHQMKYSDFAILYRTNSQSRALEESLRRMNIPYRMVGGLSFYQRKEIKDILAYLRFTMNQQDEASFRRIINLPKRGIGDATVDKIVVAANDHGAPLWDIVQNVTPFVGGRVAGPIDDFVAMIKRFSMEIERKDAYEAAFEIAKSSGLLRELYEDKTVEGLSRYENVQELLNAIKEFTDDPERQDKSLGAFLQEVSLLTGQDEEKDKDPDKVTLMTIHMAKGLEFKYVYMVGMEEDLFPSQMMINSRADLEEERRLFYVAITRAEKRLFLSYALSRYRFGRLKNSEPSRFLDDIDSSFIKVSSKFSSAIESTPPPSQYAKKLVAGIKKTVTSAPPTRPVTYKPPADFIPSDTGALQVGMRVEHPKFGFGTVLQMDTSGADRKAKIGFKDIGEKTLLLSFAKLRIVEN
ncbi:ATP-dependent helicase [Parachryseolinea silvisoli]|jgi:DNA helicase-2/ATP-dependent DNA helicase PcrA|uniref:ATP-dependent helicase n=1 Tax=Parachryseolinea silvisoli TaxID=2873601 RepID=UPI002265820C|nr:3'-5' exonuclease [Parachryseolinea silvisoli]MCD9014499.1 UvrD-helicase domain-containing protein [Parachryseolinea silvisoli]